MLESECLTDWISGARKTKVNFQQNKDRNSHCNFKFNSLFKECVVFLSCNKITIDLLICDVHQSLECDNNNKEMSSLHTHLSHGENKFVSTGHLAKLENMIMELEFSAARLVSALNIRIWVLSICQD